MRGIPTTILALFAIAAVFAGCGGDAVSSTVPAADLPTIAPAFDAQGLTVREPESGLPVFEIRAEAVRPADLRPAFSSGGTLCRCPETGLPLYRFENGSSPCLVRLGGT